MSQISDRRAKRIERVRGEIMDAAIEIISAKGFKNTTTKEIAVVAEMAEGTLYNYFKNKDDILMSIAERYVSYKRNFEPNIEAKSMEEFIASIYRSNASTVAKEHPTERKVLKALLPEFLTDKVLGKMYYERIVKPFIAQIEKSLVPMKEKGIATDYDVRIMSRILYSSMVGFAILEINNDEVIVNADDDFRRDTGKAYIEILGKGMSR